MTLDAGVGRNPVSKVGNSGKHWRMSSFALAGSKWNNTNFNTANHQRTTRIAIARSSGSRTWSANVLSSDDASEGALANCVGQNGQLNRSELVGDSVAGVAGSPWKTPRCKTICGANSTAGSYPILWGYQLIQQRYQKRLGLGKWRRFQEILRGYRSLLEGRCRFGDWPCPTRSELLGRRQWVVLEWVHQQWFWGYVPPPPLEQPKPYNQNDLQNNRMKWDIVDVGNTVLGSALELLQLDECACLVSYNSFKFPRKRRL